MRILHLGKYYSPVKGGIESTSKYIVDYLSDYEHCVLCFNDKFESKQDIVDGTSVLRTSTIAVIKSQPISLSYMTLLKKKIDEFQPEIIHFHYPNPLVALYILIVVPKNIKLVVHWHSDVVAQKSIHKLVKPIELKLVKRADAIITTSPLYGPASDILRLYQKKIFVIASAIEKKNFTYDDATERKVKKLKAIYPYKIVFFIGRHVEYKGIRYLFDSVPHIKTPCHILIAGDGPLTEDLKKKYNYENIVWLGRIADEDVKSYLYASDIFAFPSVSRNEAFGLVLAEAMYCQLPAITFTIDGSGVNWVSLKSETGIEVSNSNALEFGNAIEKLLSNDALRDQYGRNAKRRVEENFLMEIVGPQYNQLYKSLKS